MDPKACISPKPGAGCLIVIVGILSIISNCIAFARLYLSPIDRSKGLYLRLLCFSSALMAMLTIMSTSLTISACFLGNDITRLLLGAIFRLMRTADHLLLIITFIDALCTHVQLHPRNKSLKVTLFALTVVWVATVVFLEVLMCPSASCKYRPGLIVCDVPLDHVFITVDSLIFCVPVAAVLALSTGILVVESNRQNGSSTRKLSLNLDRHPTPMKQMAMVGFYISVLKTLEWGTRMTAVVGAKHLHSPSFFTMSVLIMLLGIFSIPSSLVLSLQTSEEEPSNVAPIERIRRAMSEVQQQQQQQEQEQEQDLDVSTPGSVLFRRSRSSHFVSRPLRASIFDSVEINRYNFGGMHLPLNPRVRTRSFDNTNDPRRLDMETLGVPRDDMAVSKSSDALVPIIHDDMSRTPVIPSPTNSSDELNSYEEGSADLDSLVQTSDPEGSYSSPQPFDIPSIAITFVDNDNIEVQSKTL